MVNRNSVNIYRIYVDRMLCTEKYDGIGVWWNKTEKMVHDMMMVYIATSRNSGVHISMNKYTSTTIYTYTYDVYCIYSYRCIAPLLCLFLGIYSNSIHITYLFII